MVDKLMLIGGGTKAVDIWEGNEGWTILSGDDNTTPLKDYFKLIPTLSRAVNLRANAVASMPFEIVRGKTEYDTSADWQNKVMFMSNPSTILALIEAALVVAGRAYLFRDKSRAGTKNLRYHLPASVTPIIDEVRGLQGFKRPVGQVERTFAVDDYVYFWPPDPYVEIGPSINFPAQAAANAGGVLLNVDTFAASFFKRGAIKAMLLTVEEMPKGAERTKLEDWWRRVVSGVANAFGANIINAKAITPVVIGEGLKELENVTLGEEKREDVAIALGIPMSILFANAANYATSQQDELNFLTKTVIPECNFIASVFNEQLFKPLGLKMRFLPETLDAMQEDEAQRSLALQQLTGAGVPLLMAMDILGFELSEEERAALEQAEEEKKERAAEMAQRLQGKPAGDEDDDQGPQDNGNNQAKEDLRRWERKALNALNRGDSPGVSFLSDYISTSEAQRISSGLANAKTAADVRLVFSGNGNIPDEAKIVELTAALKDVAIALREKEGE